MDVSSFIRKRYRSFGHAFEGIIQLIKTETHFRIHLIALAGVVLAGFLFQISNMEWIAILLTSSMVLIAEAVNSAIERLSDLVIPHTNKHVKRIKDISAGAVLLAAIIAAVIGLIVFLPKLIALFRTC